MANPLGSLVLPVAMLASLTLAAPQAPAESCQPIRFERGHSSAVVNGLAPADGVRCYRMSTGNGQTAELEITSGRNVIFSIEGVVDARQTFEFETRHQTYRILVGQLFRAARDEPFTLAVAIR